MKNKSIHATSLSLGVSPKAAIKDWQGRANESTVSPLPAMAIKSKQHLAPNWSQMSFPWQINVNEWCCIFPNSRTKKSTQLTCGDLYKPKMNPRMAKVESTSCIVKWSLAASRLSSNMIDSQLAKKQEQITNIWMIRKFKYHLSIIFRLCELGIAQSCFKQCQLHHVGWQTAHQSVRRTSVESGWMRCIHSCTYM